MTGYTRQSTYSDGQTILAAHSNDEYDALVLAMAAGTGHKHDNTAAEGAFVPLISNTANTRKVETTASGALTTGDHQVTGQIISDAGPITATLGNIVAAAGNVVATAGSVDATVGAVTAGTTVTAGTGVTATTGGVTATAGDVTATVGNVVATAGSVSAGTTVTAGTGVTATTGNVIATAGAVAAGTALSSVTTTTAGTGVIATTGNITAVAGDVVVTVGNVVMTAGGATVDGRDLTVDGTKLDGIEANAKDDQTAAEVVSTPAGNLAATDVQAALNELDTEKAKLAGDNTYTGNALYDNNKGIFVKDLAASNRQIAVVDLSDIAQLGNANLATNLRSSSSTNLTHNNAKIWDTFNDGAGSGLDADTVDGLQAASFLRSDASDTTTGNITVNNSAPQLLLDETTDTGNEWAHVVDSNTYSIRYPDLIQATHPFSIVSSGGLPTEIRSFNKAIYFQGNVLDTVSETSGVPTGGLIERGSNANGEFARFADGTLICTRHTATTGEFASGLTYAVNLNRFNSTRTWPSTFINSTYTRGGTGVDQVNHGWVAGGASSTTTTSVMSYMTATSSLSSISITFFAIGRWF